MRVPEWLQRTWAWISNALNIQQLLAIVGLWNITILAGGALVGLLVAVVGRFPFWGWLLAIAVSAALGLFISNEMTSRRLLHRHARPVRLTRDSPELIQFVNAWLLPAWEKALGILVRIRGEVRRIEGERNEALLQLGVIDPTVSSRRLLQDRLSGQGTSPLEMVVADAYRSYEVVVKWLWHGGMTINLAVIANCQDFHDWQVADEKLLDHLQALIANPTLELPNLTVAFREIEQGGVAKLVRLNLKKEALKLAQR
jgi:MFS family permease